MLFRSQAVVHQRGRRESARLRLEGGTGSVVGADGIGGTHVDTVGCAFAVSVVIRAVFDVTVHVRGHAFSVFIAIHGRSILPLNLEGNQWVSAGSVP